MVRDLLKKTYGYMRGKFGAESAGGADGGPFWPNTLTIESSFACNLDCVMCPRSSGNFTSSGAGAVSAVLKPETFEKIAPFIPRFNHIHFTGWGEPLVNPNLLDYLQQVKDFGVEGSFTNNGTLLKGDKAQRALDMNVDYVKFSCDASTAETFDLVRQKDQFEPLLVNLENFVKMRNEQGKKTLIDWVFVMMRCNLDEVVEAFEIAAKIGVNTFTAKHMETALDGGNVEEALFPVRRPDARVWTADDQKWYDSRLAELRAMGEKYPNTALDIHGQFIASERYCGARPEQLCVIDHEGNLSPCCFTMPLNTRPFQTELTEAQKHYVVGNVHDEPLDQLLLSPTYQNFLDAFRVGACPKACGGCLMLPRRPEPTKYVETRENSPVSVEA